MKPRAMSEWIVSAASIAVSPLAQRPGARLLLARGEERDQVERRPRAGARPRRARTRRRRGTPPPPRRAARRARPRASGRSRSGRSRSRSAASSSAARARAAARSGQSASVLPASRCASSLLEVARPPLRSFASPDFACFAIRSSRFSTWSRSATSSSSFSVSRSSAGTCVPEKPSSTTSSASTCRRLPSSAGPVPRTSTTRIAAGVTFRALTTSRQLRRGADRGSRPCRPRRPAPPRRSARRRASTCRSSEARRSRPRAPRAQASRSDWAICFWSDASARCCSDLIAPSVLSRIVATSAFAKLKTNFSVSTCCCSCESVSISSSIDSRPIDCIASSSADGSSAPSGSGTSSSGCQRRRARKWSIERLCAIRKSQAENGADCQRNLPIDSSIFRNVCVVRSSASCRLPTVTWR